MFLSLCKDNSIVFLKRKKYMSEPTGSLTDWEMVTKPSSWILFIILVIFYVIIFGVNALTDDFLFILNVIVLLFFYGIWRWLRGYFI